jgi:multidrug efflux pump subunit AcrB
MILSDIAIRNRITVLVLVVLIVLAGVLSYLTLPREAAPDVPIPHVLITTIHEGVAPADVETSVTLKIENELSGLKGVKEITSTSAEGVSIIDVEFEPDVRIEDALQYVRDKVDLAKADLPAEAEEPIIQEINVAEFPILIANITGDISLVRLKAIADELEDQIEQNVPGVLNVDVLGGLEREVRLEFDPGRARMYGLTIPELVGLIPSEHVNISAGGLDTPGTKFNVRVPAEFEEPSEVSRFGLAIRNDRPIYLTDVADVADTFKDRESYARVDGRPTVTVSVQKTVGANLVHVADAVKVILEEARQRVPAGVKIEATLDQSKFIRIMVKDLENNVLSGLVLVVLVLVMFMGLRTSVIVALAIPLSMLMSFAILQFLGYTLNMIVLFSLILALGMLVDNAIVIVENIFRHRQLGEGRIEAARNGAAEVAWPVITSTATTLAAFGPLLAWPGIMGDFMKYLPITLIITLSSSLFIAMVVSPTVCAILSGKVRKSRGEAGAIVRGYKRVLAFAIERRGLTMLLSLALLVATILLYDKRNYGLDLFPQTDPQQANINIRAAQGANIEASNERGRVVEARLEPYREQIEHAIANVGSAGGAMNFSANAGGPHIANVNLVFIDYEDRDPDYPSTQVVNDIREAVKGIPGAEIKVEKQEEGPPTGADVTVRISGRNFDRLEELAERAKRLISDVPGVFGLRTDLEATRPELVFKVDRDRALRLGADPNLIGTYLKTAIFGRKVGIYRQFNDEYDITVRLPYHERDDIDDLLSLRIPNRHGRQIPLSSLGRFEYRGGFGTIHRVDLKRVVTLTGDIEGRPEDEALGDVMSRLSRLGHSPLLAADVADWRAFARAVAAGAGAGKDEPVGYIWSRLGKDAREAFKYLAEREPPADGEAPGEYAKHRQTALDAVNARLIGMPEPLQKFLGMKVLHEGLPGVDQLDLPDEADKLLAREDKLSDDEHARLNRLLLRAVFPGRIAARQKLDMPSDYTLEYAGKREESEKAQSFLGKAFLFALLLIVLILVAQFNTLSVPLIIMTTVALSMIGVLNGLLICHMPFSIIMTGVGIISLAGVVVNNAIVLLDYTRQLQKKGLEVIEATIEAGATRLRPVLLTATTTILGLVPMATGVSVDFHHLFAGEFRQAITLASETSQWWSSMASAVIFGLAFATVLTLLVVPSLYVMLYRLAARFGLGGLHKVGEA